jgi:hypothetical protein
MWKPAVIKQIFRSRLCLRLVTNVTSVQIDNFDFGDDVDVNTFQQILDMDDGEDEGDREFSSSIVFGFLDQASETFDKMETKM